MRFRSERKVSVSHRCCRLSSHRHCYSSSSLRRGSGTAATAEAATELRSKLAGSTTLLALASIASPVATLAVSPVTTTATATERPALALLAAHHATRRGMRPLLLDVGGGDDLGGQVQPLAEVVETL